MKKMLLLALALAFTATLSACSKKEEPPRAPAQKAQPAGPVAKGRPAPEFTLTDLDGTQHRLSDYRGKVVLLNFWATWCPPCREEIPSMVKLNQLMAGKPFVMLCASIDEEGKQAIEGYYTKSGNRLPLTLLDTDRSVATLYGATGVPETFIIDKNGKIQEKAVGALNWTDPQIVTYLNSLLAQ